MIRSDKLPGVDVHVVHHGVSIDSRDPNLNAVGGQQAADVLRSRESCGEGCHVWPAWMVPPSRMPRTPSRLPTTTFTRTLPVPLTNIRILTSPKAKQLAGLRADAPRGSARACESPEPLTFQGSWSATIEAPPESCQELGPRSRRRWRAGTRSSRRTAGRLHRNRAGLGDVLRREDAGQQAAQQGGVRRRRAEGTETGDGGADDGEWCEDGRGMRIWGTSGLRGVPGLFAVLSHGA